MSSFPPQVFRHPAPESDLSYFDGCRTPGIPGIPLHFPVAFFNGSSQSRIRCKVQCGSTVVKNQNLRFPRPVPCNGQPAVFVLRKSFFHRFLLFIQPFLFLLHHFFRLRDLQGFHSSLSSHLFYATEDYWMVPRNRTAFCGTTPIFHADAGKYKPHPDRLQ